MTNETKYLLYKLQNRLSSLVFLTGAALHITSLIIGKERFLTTIFTPTFDSLFGIPMAFAGVAGILLWKNMLLDYTRKKVVYWICVSYLTLSIPMHVQTMITHDTSYINKFPETYSYVIIPVMLMFAWFFNQVKFKK
ncbi:MAG: hypothetical protein ABI723_03795 [Bacteroidia bacterium]